MWSIQPARPPASQPAPRTISHRRHPNEHVTTQDPATLALEEGTVLAEISLNEPAGAAASMPGHDSSASSSKLVRRLCVLDDCLCIATSC